MTSLIKSDITVYELLCLLVCIQMLDRIQNFWLASLLIQSDWRETLKKVLVKTLSEVYLYLRTFAQWKSV
jgi:hypothetical protein